MFRLSLGKGKAYSVACCHCRRSHYQNFNSSSPLVQADDRCLQHSEPKELYCSNAHAHHPRLIFFLHYARSDDVWQDGLNAEDDEGTKGSESAFPRQRRVSHYKLQLLEHHDVDKDLFVG